MNLLRDPAARRRLELNPLTTSVGGLPHTHQHQTPSSALSSNSLSSQFAYIPSYNTPPVSAVRPYNPQQWTTPNGSPHFSEMQAQDPEVAAVAPPPYSPPRNQRPAALVLVTDEHSARSPPTMSPPTRNSPGNLYRSSPEPATTIFPPPPSGRSRAGTGDRPQGLFGISAFSRRAAPENPRLSPEIIRENTPNSRRPVQVSSPVEQPHESHVVQETQPPASRRAVSAGPISTVTSAHSRASSMTRWAPGMPLPPPPPGPPPLQPRSQSMTRSTDRVISPPGRRPAAMSLLGPVPPTPAGWVDETAETSSRGRSPNRGLQVDTSSIGSSSFVDSISGSSSSGLTRTRAVRGEPKSIRERRSESRTGKSIATEEPSNNPWADAITPSDILVPLVPMGLPPQRHPFSRTTPRSSRSHHTETPTSAKSSSLGGQGTGSRASTPRALVSSKLPEEPTPPFSANQIKSASRFDNPAIPPKSLPTPPPQPRSNFGSPGVSSAQMKLMPNNNSAVPTPQTTSRPASPRSSKGQGSQEEQFARAAIERYQTFAHKEAAAATDSERVRMFAEFIVNESRLRRDRYAAAIDSMGSEILELTRDLFRPYNPRRESSASHTSVWTPESSTGPRSNMSSSIAAVNDNFQTQSAPTSASEPPSPTVGRPESTWWNGYMPSLSPIPSMSVSTALEESDSRGRPSSRWWEVSKEGSTGTQSMRLERSKRESKYMGVPRELREALQYENSDPAGESSAGDMAAGPSNAHGSLGPDEYPPEKVGWHTQEMLTPNASQFSAKSSATFSTTPLTPNPNYLDVSRLVTLPPPYPRHHPAVNNNHPDLTSIRTDVRVLSDLREVEEKKEHFIQTSNKTIEDRECAASKKRNSLRANIQREVAAGNMSYTDAAGVEAASVASEHERTKEAAKTDFEYFQTQVVLPLNALLMDRVARTTELFTQLRSKLFVDAQEQSPNITQEEGDEQPELLEKLTLLKWIFEAREQLHRELFELLSDRNNRYRDMVVTPYRLAGNVAKAEGAEAFFAEDERKRKLTFEQEALKRTEEFLDIIESNVIRGVEVQLSAFWDIAPGLSQVADKIPQRLDGFQVQIPQAEYDENPSYYQFPTQYLHSLLQHCEKSSYQFIESQTNLLCLLHEVKNVVTLANCRLMRTQRVVQGEDENAVALELREVEKDEETRLTDDLKEKVRCIEELWGSALGRQLKAVSERIVSFLESQGGWDEDQQAE